MLLYGDPKIGKSYAALQLAFALTRGQDWLGFPVPRPTSVAYIQLDTPRSLWADRIEALQKSGHPIEGVFFADRESLQTHPFDILSEQHFALLRHSLDSLNPGAVIIDTIREAHSGDENDSTEMQKVIAQLEAAVNPAAMILVSHSRKANPEHGYDLMNDNRGSNYIVGRMDAICRFAHASMRCTSRTMEEHSTKLERQDDGTWILAEDPFRGKAEIIIQDNPNASVRELARILHDNSDKSESASRAYIRRLLAKKRPTLRPGPD